MRDIIRSKTFLKATLLAQGNIECLERMIHNVPSLERRWHKKKPIAVFIAQHHVNKYFYCTKVGKHRNGTDCSKLTKNSLAYPLLGVAGLWEEDLVKQFKRMTPIERAKKKKKLLRDFSKRFWLMDFFMSKEYRQKIYGKDGKKSISQFQKKRLQKIADRRFKTLERQFKKERFSIISVIPVHPGKSTRIVWNHLVERIEDELGEEVIITIDPETFWKQGKFGGIDMNEVDLWINDVQKKLKIS